MSAGPGIQTHEFRAVIHGAQEHARRLSCWECFDSVLKNVRKQIYKDTHELEQISRKLQPYSRSTALSGQYLDLSLVQELVLSLRIVDIYHSDEHWNGICCKGVAHDAVGLGGLPNLW